MYFLAYPLPVNNIPKKSFLNKQSVFCFSADYDNNVDNH